MRSMLWRTLARASDGTGSEVVANDPQTLSREEVRIGSDAAAQVEHEAAGSCISGEAPGQR